MMTSESSSFRRSSCFSDSMHGGLVLVPSGDALGGHASWRRTVFGVVDKCAIYIEGDLLLVAMARQSLPRCLLVMIWLGRILVGMPPSASVSGWIGASQQERPLGESEAFEEKEMGGKGEGTYRRCGAEGQ